MSGLNTEHAVIKTKHTRANAIKFCREYAEDLSNKCIEFKGRRAMKNLHRPLALAALIGVAVIAAGTGRAADRDDTVYLRTNLVSNLQNLV